MPQYFRTIVEIEVLSVDEALGDSGEPVDLEEVRYQIIEGHMSGTVFIKSVAEVSEEDMRQLLINQGSDPSFLIEEEG